MVSVEHLSFSYPKGDRLVLDDVSFSVKAGQCMAILGNNGAGKSTLLKCMNRIHKADRGQVVVDDLDIFQMDRRTMAQKVAYVAQRVEATYMSVFDTVLLGRKPYIEWDMTKDDWALVSEIIKEMGLEPFILRNVVELSGGEAQKVMLARALAQEPTLLLLDEPTSNLDPFNQNEVLRIMRDIAQDHNICVVIVIHDLNLALRYCDQFLMLRDNKVYSSGGIEIVTAQAIADVYNIQVDIIDYHDRKVVVPL
ncbi:MAG TPA: ABC transporter ATP-binding protein [Clostridiaceae bacterium]|nr:ABC transporter ATP-binding protein [Clostridiaceae bacterium]